MPFAYRTALGVAALFSLLLCVSAVAAPQEHPPNLVLILADDLGWSDVGFNGRKEWGTPNLDRLARQGTLFRRWYTGAVTCAPSRAVLMTGRYTIHNGVTANNDDLPADETTLAEALKPLGYTSALVGKWHHGRARRGYTNYVHPLDHGFDEFFGFTDARHAWEHFPTNLWHGRELKAVRGYTATLFADRSIEFIEQNSRKPFFLYLALTESHFHIEAPAVDVARFAGKFAERGVTNVNATYAAMITRMDHEIGRVLKKLRDAQLEEDTLVVFTSDHGATFENGNRGASSFHDSNRPFRGQKRLLWEGGIRVPGVVRWPGRVPARKTSDAIVHMMDVFPTFLAAAGGTPDPSWRVDGINLLPVWMGRIAAAERTLFWEWRTENYNQVAAMRGDFKLVITGNTTPELYNVATDPAERRTIFHEYTERGRELRRQLTNWLSTETEAAKWGKTNRPSALTSLRNPDA
jgi:arylsulfatase A